MWEIILNWVELHPWITGIGIAFVALVIWSVWCDTRPNRCGYCGSLNTKKTGQGRRRYIANKYFTTKDYPPDEIVHYYTCNPCRATFDEHVKEKAPRKRRCKECRTMPFSTKRKRFCLKCCMVMVFKAGRPLEPYVFLSSWLGPTLSKPPPKSAGSGSCIGCGCSMSDAPGFYGSGHSKAGYCYDCGDS